MTSSGVRRERPCRCSPVPLEVVFGLKIPLLDVEAVWVT